MTSSPRNVHLDGHGDLDITASATAQRGIPRTAGPRAGWRPGPAAFGARPGGEMMVTASIKQPDVAHGLGYWPGFWMLGSPFEVAGDRGDRHHGGC